MKVVSPRLQQTLQLLAALCLWLGTAAPLSAQAPAQPPAAQSPAPPAAPPGYPAQVAPQQAAPQQAYPQQAYPQQAYPQQAYPQQTYPQPYPQQAYPQQAYPQQAYQQPYAPAGYPPRARRPRLSRGMMIAGISVLSASYAVALISGSALLDSRCCSDVGAMMMIPVLGPFLALGEADEGRALLSLLGAVELVGTGLLIGGIVRYRRSKRAAEAEGYYTFQLPRGRTLSVDASASPRLVGPSLRLRF